MVSDIFDNTLTDFLFLKEEDQMNYILDMLNTLTKREENVLRMYFGIDRERRLTMYWFSVNWNFPCFELE